MAENRIRIGVLDNCPVVIRGLQAILSAVPDVEFKGGYTSLKDLAAELTEQGADILFAEISVNDDSVEHLISFLRKKLPQSKIIVFSLLESIYHVKLVMRQGASGYLLKTCTEEEIISAIRHVFAGQQYIDSGIKEKIFQKALLNKKAEAEEPKLTKREKEILQLLASNYTSKDISNKLYISLKTVENHRSNMLVKFRVKNAASLIKRAIELDLLDDE